MVLHDRVLRTIRQYALACAGSRVLVALSGGSDSVALLHLMRELEAEGHVSVAGVAHLNHLLRGSDADADEAFCRRLAMQMNVPFIAERIDVRVLADQQKRSLEDAARMARYAFLEQTADRLEADVIAVGHSRDDQAETFLLRLLRGSSTRGLGSIRPRAGRVIRPLIEIRRSELRQYLAERGIEHREDETNADVAIPRNRVRHELIPLLESRFSPAITDVLARNAAVAQRDEDFLHHLAIETARQVVLSDDRPGGDCLQIDAGALRSAPIAVASRVAHDVLCRLAGSRPISFDHVQRLLTLAQANAPEVSVSFPGQQAVRCGGVIELHAARDSARQANSFSRPLSIPGEVALVPQGWAIAAERLTTDAAANRRYSAKGPEVGVAAGRLLLPLAVRSRRPGDRFRPLGAPGTRKLQDFLVDRKVPRAERDTLPLVVDAQDRIVWVAGQSVAEGFRVLDSSQGVILLKVRRLGGPG
jgi:tRNA(Ile)-lysidine synthase